MKFFGLLIYCTLLAGCSRNDVIMFSQGASIGGMGTPLGAAASIVGLSAQLTKGGSSDPAPVSIKNGYPYSMMYEVLKQAFFNHPHQC